MKICTKCKISKSLNDFYRRKASPNGIRPSCKKCESELNKKWLNGNTEIKAKYNKQWRSENGVKINIYSVKHKNARLAYHKNRMRTDLLYKLQQDLRTRLNRAIKNDLKSGSAVKDLGCSIAELKLHLESKFQQGMTWGNKGKTGWHIDHIKPLSKFDLSNLNELKQACHYTNLQPLWAIDNLKKGAK